MPTLSLASAASGCIRSARAACFRRRENPIPASPSATIERPNPSQSTLRGPSRRLGIYESPTRELLPSQDPRSRRASLDGLMPSGNTPPRPTDPAGRLARARAAAIDSSRGRRRPLSRGARARPRRDGARLPRARREARARRRDQGDPAGALRLARPRPLPARDRDRRAAASPEHRPALRFGRGRRLALLRDAVRGGPVAARAARRDGRLPLPMR